MTPSLPKAAALTPPGNRSAMTDIAGNEDGEDDEDDEDEDIEGVGYKMPCEWHVHCPPDNLIHCDLDTISSAS